MINILLLGRKGSMFSHEGEVYLKDGNMKLMVFKADKLYGLENKDYRLNNRLVVGSMTRKVG